MAVRDDDLSSNKKIANPHYPGLKVDPNEGRSVFDSQTLWRFQEQLGCIGEPSQRVLQATSVFVLSASPLGVATVKRLLQYGIGRVGVFGEMPRAGASGLGGEDVEQSGTLRALAKWAKTEAPWACLESFCEVSIDRTLNDMARGFDALVGTGDHKMASETLRLGREHKLPVTLADVRGRQAFCAAISEPRVCEDCVELAVLEGQGLYFPLLEFAAGWVATLVVESALQPRTRSSFIESIDASHSPWLRETRELLPKAGCAKCLPALK